jgi:hypothetical protein
MGFSPCGATKPDVVFRRNRLLYSACMVAVVIVGLLWRSSWLSLPGAVGKYGGDALWSLFVLLGFGLLLPRSSTQVTAILALAFSSTVETSQLWHPPWLDATRQTRLGALGLGSVFHWPGFVAYTVGIGVGAGADWGLPRIIRLLCPHSQPTEPPSERPIA